MISFPYLFGKFVEFHSELSENHPKFCGNETITNLLLSTRFEIRVKVTPEMSEK